MPSVCLTWLHWVQLTMMTPRAVASCSASSRSLRFDGMFPAPYDCRTTPWIGSCRNAFTCAASETETRAEDGILELGAACLMSSERQLPILTFTCQCAPRMNCNLALSDMLTHENLVRHCSKITTTFNRLLLLLLGPPACLLRIAYLNFQHHLIKRLVNGKRAQTSFSPITGPIPAHRAQLYTDRFCGDRRKNSQKPDVSAQAAVHLKLGDGGRPEQRFVVDCEILHGSLEVRK